MIESHKALASIYIILLCKNTLDEKSEAKSEAPVTSINYIQLKGMISGRGQGHLRFNHFVGAAIYNHVQTNSKNACGQTIETSTTIKETKYSCGQHLCNSQL